MRFVTRYSRYTITLTNRQVETWLTHVTVRNWIKVTAAIPGATVELDV